MGNDILGVMEPERFQIRAGRRSLILLRLWGVKPDLAYAEVGEGQAGELRVRFGRVRFNTPLGNIARWQIEGPFRWVTAIGIRRSIRHGDVSFAGAAHGGVRLDFHVPVRWSLFRVPAIYVGADDLEAFASALSERGISGRDIRRAGP
jgi:hypothetical protein